MIPLHNNRNKYRIKKYEDGGPISVRDLLNVLSQSEPHSTDNWWKEVQPLLDATGSTYAEDAVKESYDYNDKWLASPMNRKLTEKALLDSELNWEGLSSLKTPSGESLMSFSGGTSPVDKIIESKQTYSRNSPIAIYKNPREYYMDDPHDASMAPYGGRRASNFDIKEDIELPKPYRPGEDRMVPLGGRAIGATYLYDYGKEASSAERSSPYIMGLPQGFQSSFRPGAASLHDSPEQLKQIALHERSHQQDLNNLAIKEMIIDRAKRSDLDEKGRVKVWHNSSDMRTRMYIGKPTETAARVSVIRQWLYGYGVDVFNKEIDLSKHEEALQDLFDSTGGPNAYSELKKIYSKDQIEYLLNNLPA